MSDQAQAQPQREPTDTPLFPAQLQAQLDKLHAASETQEANIDPAAVAEIRSTSAVDETAARKLLDELMVDKFIALEKDKCHFVYSVILATGATRVVEVGTSFGVSTVYLVHAVNLNLERRGGGDGVVVGTEKEEGKAAKAREYWKEAGKEIEERIDLRVGDLRETLARDLPDVVDLVLLDIWPYMALPALQLLLPKMRPGAVVFTDNVISAGPRYAELLAVLRDPNGPFKSICVPYKNGFEMSIYQPDS